jgi:hypothetical protein
LRREVREEVQLDVEVGDLLFAAEVLNLGTQDVVLIFNASIRGIVEEGSLDLVSLTSPEVAGILPPVVGALTAARAGAHERRRWLGNVAVAEGVDR